MVSIVFLTSIQVKEKVVGKTDAFMEFLYIAYITVYDHVY